MEHENYLFLFLFFNCTVLLHSVCCLNLLGGDSVCGASSPRTSTGVFQWLPPQMGTSGLSLQVTSSSSMSSFHSLFPLLSTLVALVPRWTETWCATHHPGDTAKRWVLCALITKWWKKPSSACIFKSSYSDADFSFRDYQRPQRKHESCTGHFPAERSEPCSWDSPVTLG